jgi:hypothetical protein
MTPAGRRIKKKKTVYGVMTPIRAQENVASLSRSRLKQDQEKSEAQRQQTAHDEGGVKAGGTANHGGVDRDADDRYP